MTRSRISLALLAAVCLSFAGCLEEPSSSYDGPHAYLEVTNANFEEVVLNSDKPVLVDFWATWCPPCVALAPTIAEVSHEYDGKAVVAKVDVDQAQELAQKYGIKSIPTLIFFKNGEEVTRMVGAPSSSSTITQQLDSMLN